MLKPKILIVDDDEGIRTQLKWGLENYETITADTRLQAIEQFELHQPPLVTLDLGLPPDAEGTAEGFAVLKQIMDRAPDTKVIIISGSGDPANAEKARSHGAFEYYPKPVEINRLQQVIEQAYADYQANLHKN